MSAQQLLSVASVPDLSCEVTSSRSSSHYLATLLQQAAGTVNLAPIQFSLPCQGITELQAPHLLSHISPSHRVRLLALTAAAVLQQQQQQQTEPLQRQTLYSATLLQHAALLLLLLVSDSLVLLVPAPVVPPAVLQLLHVLPKVKQQLLQQIDTLQKRSKAAAGRGASKQQPHTAADSCGDAAATAEEECSPDDEQHDRQQFDQLLQLLHKPPTRLHVVLQVAAASEAQAAVKQAEHTLTKCKAASAAAVDSINNSSTVRRSTSGRNTTTTSSLLFILAGVHACAAEECRAHGVHQSVHRAVLKAIQQQLLPHDTTTQQLQQQHLKEQQQHPQQQLLTADKVLANIAANTAAVESSDNNTPHGVIKVDDLQQLWQQLLRLLFPSFTNSSSSNTIVTTRYSLYNITPLQLDSSSSDDVISASDDDADWDEVDDSWQEVSHAESAHGGAESAAGDLLAAAVDPLYHMSLKRCTAAAQTAFRAYLQAVPERYPLSVHKQALASSLLLYDSLSSGPAAADVRVALCCCCLTAWQSGRQQCGAVSLTGRSCVRHPHDEQQEAHSSGTAFTLAAPDGSEQQQQQDDWFSFTAANVWPAQTLLKQQLPQKQQGDAVHCSQLLQTVVRLLSTSGNDSTANQTDGDSQQQQQLVLGQWLSLWTLQAQEGTSNPAAAAAAAAALGGVPTTDLPSITLPGQRWLPGLGSLLPVKVLTQQSSTQTAAGGSVTTTPAAAVGGPAADIVSDDDGDDYQEATDGDSKDILRGILEGLHVKGSKAAAAAAGSGGGGRRGRGDRGRGGRAGAAAAAAGNDVVDADWNQTAARAGRRGRGRGRGTRQEPAAAAAVTLGPEEFPTLAEAATGSSRKGLEAGKPQQQQHQQQSAGQDVVATVTPGAVSSSSTQQGKRAAADAVAVNSLQQQLLVAWSKLGQQQQQQQQQAGSSSSSYRDVSVSHSAASGERQPARGTAAAAAAAGRRGRGRGHRGAAAAAVTSRGLNASTAAGGGGGHVADTVVLTQLWIGLEYENLAGQRCILQPRHLLKFMQQQQQPTATAAAATMAAAAAARNLPGGRGGGRSGARGGRASQQQQQQHGSSTPPVSSRSASAVRDHTENSTAEQLLLQDVPLFVHMAAVAEQGSNKARPPSPSPPAAAAAAVSVGTVSPLGQSNQPVDVELLQLKRIYIRTPPAPFTFASQPRIRFAAAAAAVTAPGSSNVQQTAAASTSNSGSSSSSSISSVLEFSSSEGVVLPADSLLVLNLPQVYGAPADWVQGMCAAAADAVAAAGVVLDTVTGTEHRVITTAERTKGENLICADPRVANVPVASNNSMTNIDSSTDTAVAATAEVGEAAASSAVVSTKVLLPLLPVQVPQAAAVAASAVGSDSAPASSTKDLWHAVLCGRSWLYPAASVVR